MAKSKPLKVLIVGCGSAGKRHAQHLTELGAELGYCDMKFVQEGGLSCLPIPTHGAFSNIQAALSGEWHGVVIATPPGEHVQLATKVARQGKHAQDNQRAPALLIEKPFCSTNQHADKAIDLLNVELEARQGKAMVAYNWRYHPLIRSFKRDVMRLTGIYANQWRQRIPGWGIIEDHASHDFDLLFHLNGLPLTLDAGLVGVVNGLPVSFVAEGWSGNERYFVSDNALSVTPFTQLTTGREPHSKTHDLVPVVEMYTDMLKDFLALCRDEETSGPVATIDESLPVQRTMAQFHNRRMVEWLGVEVKNGLS